MKTPLLAGALLASLAAHTQSLENATAIFHFDGSLECEVTQSAPTNPLLNNVEYVENRFGDPEKAVSMGTLLNYGNPAFSQLSQTDFTIAFWFKKTGSLWPGRSLLEKRIAPSEAPYTVGYGCFVNQVVGTEPSMTSSYRAFLEDDPVQAGFGTFADDTWNHFVLRVDRDSLVSTYLNFEQVANVLLDAPLPSSAVMDSAELTMGWSSIVLDELYFFDYAVGEDERAELFYTNTVGVDDQPTATTVTAFPNPTQDQLHIQGDWEGIVSVDVYGLDGRQILRTETQLPVVLDTQNWTPGMYAIQLIGDRGQSRFEVVKR